MFGLSQFGKRLVEGVVSLFAVLGFVYVPLGHHTGLEHAKAVFSTPAATAAIDDLTKAALDLRQRAVDFATGHLSKDTATDSAPPRASASLPKPHAPGREPRPVPPKLK